MDSQIWQGYKKKEGATGKVHFRYDYPKFVIQTGVAFSATPVLVLSMLK